MPIGLRDISGIDHERFMTMALEEARIAGERGDLPIGAIIVHDGEPIARGSNRIYTKASSIDHAEIMALHGCASYLREHGRDSIIYSTLEPCFMCLSTIIQANIRNIVFAMEDSYLKTGKSVQGVGWLTDRMFNYRSGVLREESLALLKKYCNERDYELIVHGSRPSETKVCKLRESDVHCQMGYKP